MTKYEHARMKYSLLKGVTFKFDEKDTLTHVSVNGTGEYVVVNLSDITNRVSLQEVQTNNGVVLRFQDGLHISYGNNSDLYQSGRVFFDLRGVRDEDILYKFYITMCCLHDCDVYGQLIVDDEVELYFAKAVIENCMPIHRVFENKRINEKFLSEYGDMLQIPEVMFDYDEESLLYDFVECVRNQDYSSFYKNMRETHRRCFKYGILDNVNSLSHLFMYFMHGGDNYELFCKMKELLK